MADIEVVIYVLTVISIEILIKMSNKTFKKLSVIKLSTNFAEATKEVEVPLIPPNDNQVLLKNIYVGVNASDINITAGRFTDGNLPFDIELEE